MKRILGTVAALSAVLAFSTVSSAAIINFDLSATGSGGVLQTGSTLAPPPGYFTTPFSAGSTVQVNTDTNGDTIEGDVSLVSGTLNIAGVTDLGAYGTFISDTVVTLAGGVGTLSGENILWTGANTTTATSGTFGCTGAICGLIGISEGTVYDISVYEAFVASLGNVAVNPLTLGVWQVTGGVITGSSMAINATNAGSPASWYLFGANNLGPPVPEPATFALVLLGLGGLALRSRKA